MRTPISTKCVLIGLSAVLLGCGASSYMPLEKGREWKYLISTPSGSSVASMTVVEKIRVGLTMGWKISGDKGENRLAWSGAELVASELSAAQFDPPITLLKANSESETWHWEGVCRSRGFEAKATADCDQKADKIKIAGSDRVCLLSVLRLRFRDSIIELRTWFQSGVGVVRQEQRMDGKLMVALEWIGGS
jgi:hypothetical protein